MSVTPIQAAILRPIKPVKPIILPTNTPTIIESIQESLKIITSKFETLEKKIIELEQKIANLTGSHNEENFSIPEQWNIEFYKAPYSGTPINGNGGCTETSCLIYSSTFIKISSGDSHCTWKGINIDSLVTTRMIGHLQKEIYGVGTCKEMIFENINNLPESGNTFDVDIHFFWQGSNKDKKINVTIPLLIEVK